MVNGLIQNPRRAYKFAVAEPIELDGLQRGRIEKIGTPRVVSHAAGYMADHMRFDRELLTKATEVPEVAGYVDAYLEYRMSGKPRTTIDREEGERRIALRDKAEEIAWVAVDRLKGLGFPENKAEQFLKQCMTEVDIAMKDGKAAPVPFF